MTFIPPTEHCNLMPMSDNWVIENVLKQLDKNKIDTVYAVNLSGQSLIDNKSTQHTTYNIQQKPRLSQIWKTPHNPSNNYRSSVFYCIR